MKPKGWLILLGVFFFLVNIGGLICLYRLGYEFTTQNWIVAGGVLFALLGWVVTAFVSLHNSIKQHTINVLLQSRLSTAFQERYKQLTVEFCPRPKEIRKVTLQDISNPEKRDALSGLQYFLNYYEFIAVGLKQGDLDEKLLKECVSGIVSRLYDISEEYIKHVRGINSKGKPEDPTLYEYFIELHKKWCINDGAPLDV